MLIYLCIAHKRVHRNIVIKGSTRIIHAEKNKKKQNKVCHCLVTQGA